ncbi:hypothetical protein ACT2CC_00505 [Candidatus Vidania fulgoroideorum]
MNKSLYKRIRLVKKFIKFKKPGRKHNLEKKTKKKKNEMKKKFILKKHFKYEN